MQGICAQLTGEDLCWIALWYASIFGVVVFHASMLNWLGGPSAKVCSSAKFCVMVFKANITCQSWNLIVIWGVFWGVLRALHLTWLYNAHWLFTTLIIQKSEEIPTFSCRIQNGCQIYPIIYISWCIGGPLAKVGSSAKFGAAVFKASILNLLGGRTICQVVLSAKFGVAVFKASIPYFLGVHLPKVCSSTKFCVLVFKANITCQSWNLLLSFGGCFGGLHLTWLYNANWLFTTLIIQKWKEIPTFSWRIQNGCQIYPIIYIHDALGVG